jgi:hypothetical protein
MPTSRSIKGVLHTFLGAYTSRNADYLGYWLHGQLGEEIRQCRFDLLGSTSERDAPFDAARRLAKRVFAEQVLKSGLTLDSVREATLRITQAPELVKGQRGDSMADGHRVRYAARVVMVGGRAYQQERTIFVARHDPKKERRRRDLDSDA